MWIHFETRSWHDKNIQSKIQSYPFCRKLVHMVSQGWWFQIQTEIFEIPASKLFFWANICPKIQSCLFRLKIGGDSISKMLIRNLDLDFWNSLPKISLGANLGSKIGNCLFCLKIGAHSTSRMLIPNLDLDFWNSNPKKAFWGKFKPKDLKLSVLSGNWCTQYLKDADSQSRLRFLKIRLQNLFLGEFKPKHSKLSVLSENWCT